MLPIPVISQSKNYWLIRTQSGKYYNEFKIRGFIGINWNSISFEDLEKFDEEDVKTQLRENYSDIQRLGTTYNQLRIFSNVIKQGDTVVITGVNSNKFSIGEVISEGYTAEIDEDQLERFPNLCPYTKRKDVKWLKELHKWDVEMDMFKLLQHAQHTISDANEYKDIIEGMIRDFYIRGDYAQISLQVSRESSIPPKTFFEMGNELLNLVDEFEKESTLVSLNIDDVSTTINVNSPGKIKFKGAYKTIFVIGILFVGIAGGGFKVELPKSIGGGTFEIEMNSITKEISDFLDKSQERNQKELLLQQYIHDLEMESPDELSRFINSLETKESDSED